MGRPITLTEYYAKSGSRITDRDARIIGPELQRLAAEDDLTATRLVSEARPEASGLHPYFTWEDARAAELYREQEARILMNSVEVVVVRDDGQKVRAPVVVHVHISADERTLAGLDDTQQSPYLTLERVVSEDGKLAQKMAEAQGFLIHWKQKYAFWAACSAEFQERFQTVFDAIEQAESEDAEQEPVKA